MGHTGIMETLGAKEAGCGQKIGHLTGGTGQKAAAVKSSLQELHSAAPPPDRTAGGSQ